MTMRRLGITMALVVGLVATTERVQATTIAFDGSQGVILPGDVQTEGNFTYEALSGALFRSGSRGNPAPDLEGQMVAPGGVAVFKRTDGGLFTLDQVDVGQIGLGISRFVVFEGFLDGLSKGHDSLESSSTPGAFLTRTPVNLLGMPLDELRVQLEAQPQSPGPEYAEMIDNLVLTEASSSVPEPGTLGLLGLGLAALAYFRRRTR